MALLEWAAAPCPLNSKWLSMLFHVATGGHHSVDMGPCLQYHRLGHWLSLPECLLWSEQPVNAQDGWQSDVGEAAGEAVAVSFEVPAASPPFSCLSASSALSSAACCSCLLRSSCLSASRALSPAACCSCLLRSSCSKPVVASVSPSLCLSAQAVATQFPGTQRSCGHVHRALSLRSDLRVSTCGSVAQLVSAFGC